jgi:hypothetical protein
MHTILEQDGDGRADDPSSAAQGRRLEDQAPYPIARQHHFADEIGVVLFSLNLFNSHTHRSVRA